MLRLLFSATVFLTLLSGCGGDAQIRSSDGKQAQGETLTLQELGAAYDAGDYSSVIASPRGQNLPLAEQTQRQFFYLSSQLQLEPLTVTENQFAAIDYSLLPLHLQLEYQLNYASFLKTSDPDKALQQLKHPVISTNALREKPELFARFYRLRAEINNQMGFSVEAANDYIKREQFIVGESHIAANQITLWMLLSHLPQETLDGIILGERSPTLQGWADLIAITRELTRFPDEFSEQITLWKNRYPEHPAQEKMITDLLDRNRKLVLNPKQIAVLLPLSGSYAHAGAAIRDGILAGYLADNHKDKVTLRFYDTAGNPEFIETIYQKAINDGAEFILGPLNKKVVQRLMTISANYSIPALTLNLTEEGVQENVYQFSLSPEDEAINVANRAWHEGYSRISLLLPESTLGKRASQAFRKRWEAYGGTIASSEYYNPKLNDFSTPIKSLLDIHLSEARRKSLRETISEKFEFIPRPRDDIEIIFISAEPRQARIIKPQLRFHHAADIPVIATADLYSGEPDKQHDRDMDGILFGDMPWNVRQSNFSKSNSYLNKKYSGQLKRLVAMGIDSYQIIPLLPILSAYPNELYQGESGKLSLNESHQIERLLSWSQFKGGVPRAMKDIIYVEPTADEKDEKIDGNTLQQDR
jgi:outer membrane PBP1 activator LpoA protein